MSSDAVRAYVRDIVDHHAGHRQEKLEELEARLKTSVGDFDGQGVPDPEVWANWRDLQYVQGYLETGGAKYQDCIDTHDRIERRIARNEQHRRH